jgi:hypothetical protein
MKAYRYKVFNPKIEKLENVLTVEPIESDWLLLKIIPYHEYESVAVFEKMNFNEE